MKNENYFLSDIKRLFKSYEIYIAIIGVMLSLFFSLEDNGIQESGVLSTYMLSLALSGRIIAYAFCALPYATVFCEDLENKYVRYQIIRGNLKKYVLSKVMVIYISSVITMVLGTLLFLFICRIQVSWADLQMDSLNVELAGNYAFLISGKHYFLYCLLFSLHLGLLAGIFSVFAAYFSLYISNKVTVLILPVVVYQILLEYSRNGIISVALFYPYNKAFAQDWLYFFVILIVSIFITVLLMTGIYKKIKIRL